MELQSKYNSQKLLNYFLFYANIKNSLEAFGEKKTKEKEKTFNFKCFQKKNQETFKETIYFSGDMAYLCRVLVNFRRWRQSASPSSNPKRLMYIKINFYEFLWFI